MVRKFYNKVYIAFENFSNFSSIFPWVLKVFNIAAYDFYKVIELVVRADSELPRDVIKHLQIVIIFCLKMPLKALNIRVRSYLRSIYFEFYYLLSHVL